MLTWRFLYKGWKVYFEPLAVAFTDAPASFGHFVKQRSRWARGMIEGLIEIRPWNQPQVYQMIMSPVSVLGYLQELFKLKRVWK